MATERGLGERIEERLREGRAQAGRFNTLDAGRAFLEALSLARGHRAALGAAAEEAESEALRALAELDESAGRLADALARFGESARIALLRDLPRHAAQALCGTGQVLLHRRDLPGALAALERACEAAERSGCEESLLRARILLAHARSLDGAHEAADEALRASVDRLKIRIARGYDSPVTRELRCLAGARLAIGFLRRRLPEEAETLLEEALEAVEPIEHSVAKAEALRYLGVARSGDRAYVEAVEFYARALAILKYCYHAPSLARLYASIGRTWLDAGDLAQAQANFAKARSLCLKLDLASNVAEFASMLGHIALRREEYEEARRLYREDFAITEGLPDKLARGYARRNLAAASLRLGDPAGATAHLDEAERLFREARSRHNVAHTLLLRGELFVGRGYLEGARDAADEAEEIFHALERLEEIGHVELLRGRIDAAGGDPSAALVRLARAVSIFRDARSPFPLLAASEALAEVASAAGRKELALRAYAEAAALAQKHRLARTADRIASALERVDEAGLLGLSVRRLSAEGQAAQKDEKEETVSLAVRADASVHLLVGLAGLEPVAARAGVERAQAVASRVAAAVCARLFACDCRLNFHAGFALSFLAAPREGGDPVDTLARVVRAASENSVEVGRILLEELGPDEGELPVSFLVDLCPLTYLAFTVGAVRENFPVSDRARTLLTLLLTHRPSAGATVHLTEQAAAALSASGGFVFGESAFAGVPLARLLAVR